MKKLSKIFLLSIALFLLTSCNDYKYRVSMPTAGTGGSLYPLGASIAKVLNRTGDFKASLEASGGGIDNLNIIYDKDANISFGVSSIVSMSYEGEGIFKGRENKHLRVIASLYLNPNQVVVLKDKNINSLRDLENKKFSSGAVGSSTEMEYYYHMDAVGSEKENKVHLGPRESMEEMKMGAMDGVWIMAGAPSAQITEMLLTTNSKVLSIPEEEIEKVIAKYPWYEKYTIKKDVYNTDEDIETTATRMLIYTRDDCDEELVYNFTKVFWENIEELKKENKVLKTVKIEEAEKGAGVIPIHPGAMKYYKEVLK